MSRILVVGGAGYVGSTTCVHLLDEGHEVWVLDDLSTGHRHLVAVDQDHFIFGRAGDTKLVEQLVTSERFDCVMHFAARSLVEESFVHAEAYYENNVQQTEALLEILLKHDLKNFIFSSTCAVYEKTLDGVSAIPESFPKDPATPYGKTKLEVENRLSRLARERGLRALALRYFNAAGAETKLRVGEWHEPETHLIPRILGILGNSGNEPDAPMTIYGSDYSTPDGTCVRDYIHVSDVAEAHIAAMKRLLGSGLPVKGTYEAFNLGSGRGYSILEIIAVAEKILGRKIKTQVGERRVGDVPRLVADTTLAQRELGFGPGTGPETVKKLRNIEEILMSAWAWEQKRRKIKRPAIFLDRDGTLNEDPGYLNDPTKVKLLPGVAEGLVKLRSCGYLLVIVSNQSGVGRGRIEPEALVKVNKRLDELLSQSGVYIDEYKLCLHVPDVACECRKPKPKMILDAAEMLNIDLSRSYMIGDRKSDLLAGTAAGCKGSILVKTGLSAEVTDTSKVSYVGDSILQISDWILNQENANS